MKPHKISAMLIVIRILLIAVMLSDMAFIFFNSHQTATESSSASQSVTEKVVEVIVPNYEKMDEEEKKETVNAFDSVVREAAHLLQFVPMGFACYLLLCTMQKLSLHRYLNPIITLTLGVAYALSDEIHQIFTPGRVFDAFDIMMDSIGVTVGIACGALLMLIITAIKRHRAPTEQ